MIHRSVATFRQALYYGVPIAMLLEAEEALVYLTRDEFITADPAPLTAPRTAEPGPGTWTVVGDATLSISGGELKLTGSAIESVHAGSLSRASGVMYYTKLDGATTGEAYFGFDNDALNQPSTFGIRSRALGSFWVYEGGSSSFAVLPLLTAQPTSWEISLILRSSGGFYCYNADDSGWKIAYVYVADSTALLYPAVYTVVANTVSVDHVYVAQLASPWNTDYGIATDVHLGNVPADTAFIHEPDSLFEFTITTMPASGTVERFFRMQDANNLWSISIAIDGEVALYDNIGGSWTNRAQSSVAAVTNGSRVVVTADGQVISVYGDNLLLFSYALATAFQTETAGKLDFSFGSGMAIEDDIVWPRTLSGAALTELEKYTQPYDVPPTFLLQDEFLTYEAAPLTAPRTAEPGPGTWTVTGAATLSISGGELKLTVEGESLFDESRSRTTGLTHITKFSGTDKRHVFFGFGADAIIVPRQVSGRTRGGGAIWIYDNQIANTGAIPVTSEVTTWHFGSSLRSQGAFYYYRADSATWILAWVGINDITDPVYASIFVPATDVVDVSVDYCRIAQLGTPWDTDNGIATDVHAGSVSQGTTFTHEADCLIEYVITTLPSGNEINMHFRKQDANNYWLLNTNAGGAMSLQEVVAGVGTQRAAIGGTLSGGERITIICDDETITWYYNNSQAASYGSAANFKTETDGELNDLGTGGAISDLITWPRTLSGDALTELEKYTQPYDGPVSPTFLFQDEFVTNEAAPIVSPRTAEPGPGTLTIVENDGAFDISSGKLQITSQTTAAWADLGFYDDGQTRATGILLINSFNFSTISAHVLLWMQVEALNTSTNANVEIAISLSANNINLKGVLDISTIGTYSNSTNYQSAIILRSAGSFILFLISGSWKLLYVENITSTATLYSAHSDAGSGAGSIDFHRVAQLATPWNTDNGIATDVHAGSVAQGTAFVHEADCIIEFEITTLPPPGLDIVDFRIQDSTNFWRFGWDDAGAAVLQEIVADVPTQRGSIGIGGISNGDRIVIIADDETVTIYVNASQQISYLSAANFKTETDGILRVMVGQVSDLITWPRTLSGDALTELERHMLLPNNSAVEFNNSSTVINCGSDSSLDDIPAALFSFDGWINFNDITASANEILMAKGTGWWYGVTSGSRIDFYVYRDTTNARSVRVASGITSDWHHILGQYDPAGDSKIYIAVDGVWSTYEVQTAGDGAYTSDAGNDLLLGSRGPDFTTLDGAIAWARISDISRWTVGVGFTPPEKDAPPDVDANTIEQWNLNKGYGSKAIAEISTANDGTITAGNWIAL